MLKLKSETITIEDEEFEVRELTPRQVLPLLSTAPDELAIEIAKLSVHQDGSPMGESLLDMGFSSFNKLLSAVTSINGLGEEAGKD